MKREGRGERGVGGGGERYLLQAATTASPSTGRKKVRQWIRSQHEESKMLQDRIIAKG